MQENFLSFQSEVMAWVQYESSYKQSGYLNVGHLSQKPTSSCQTTMSAHRNYRDILLCNPCMHYSVLSLDTGEHKMRLPCKEKENLLYNTARHTLGIYLGTFHYIYFSSDCTYLTGRRKWGIWEWLPLSAAHRSEHLKEEGFYIVSSCPIWEPPAWTPACPHLRAFSMPLGQLCRTLGQADVPTLDHSHPWLLSLCLLLKALMSLFYLKHSYPSRL